MKHRKLRIVWSVAWGIAALLLIALWVRSYWKWDYASYQRVSLYGITSEEGHVVFQTSYNPKLMGWRIGSEPSAGIELFQRTHAFFDYDSYPTYTAVFIPHWFLALMTAAVVTLPWIRSLGSRYSLRTLLIATTLVAVGLGLSVWLVR